jgi:DNA-binding GntR family transcriptional regulator
MMIREMGQQMKQMMNYGDGPRVIYEILKQQIISGERDAGSDLKIMPLAKDMDISIVPLREAIRMLAAENLVELRPRRTPIVARLDERDLIEMNQIRGALEPIVLADAVPRHTADSLGKCEELLEQDRVSTDLWEKVELNKSFHLAILNPSRLNRSIEVISDQYDGIARITQFRVFEHINMIGQYNFEHDTILSASRDGDVDAAVNLMMKHIDKATERAKNEFHHDEEEDAAQVSASKSSSA